MIVSRLGNIRYIFTAYATLAFSKHLLLTTVNAIIGVVAAASQPVYARLSDVLVVWSYLSLLFCSMLLVPLLKVNLPILTLMLQVPSYFKSDTAG